jgi:hypothetical protein
MTKNKLACRQRCFRVKFRFLDQKQKLGKFRNILVSNVNVTNFFLFWLNSFPKIFTPKKWEKKKSMAFICIKNYYFKQISII